MVTYKYSTPIDSHDDSLAFRFHTTQEEASVLKVTSASSNVEMLELDIRVRITVSLVNPQLFFQISVPARNCDSKRVKQLTSNLQASILTILLQELLRNPQTTYSTQFYRIPLAP